jgi:hypothetical protein
MPTCMQTDRTTKYTEVGVMVSGLVSENLHDMHRYQKRMHQDTWYMSITHHSLPSTVQSKYHTQTCSALRHKGIHPLYHHHDPYNNAIVIDECHFDASDHVRYGWTHKSERLPKRKKDRPQRLSVVCRFQDMVWC